MNFVRLEIRKNGGVFNFVFSSRRVYFVLMQEEAHHGKVRSKSVQGPFGLRSGQFQTKISGAKNIKISKTFSLCGRRRGGGGPLAAVPSPVARKGPRGSDDGHTN